MPLIVFTIFNIITVSDIKYISLKSDIYKRTKFLRNVFINTTVLVPFIY